MSRSGLTAVLVVLAATVAAPAAEVRGVVMRVDNDRKELVLDARGKGVRGLTLSFRLAPEVAVTVGQQPGRAAEIVAGKHVRVTYDERDGKRVATAVHVFALLQALQNVLPVVPPAPVVQPAPATPAAPPVAVAPSAAQSGTLRRVAYTEREIILACGGLDGKETYIVLHVPPDCPVRRDGKPIRFDDLKEGEAAAVGIEQRDGKTCAGSIDVGQVPSSPAIAPAPGAPLPAGKPSKINQLRRILQMADQVLEQLEQAQKQPR